MSDCKQTPRGHTIAHTRGTGRLVEYRPGTFAREGARITIRESSRHKPVVWEFVVQGHDWPGWVSVAGPRGHHKLDTPPELLTMTITVRVVHGYGGLMDRHKGESNGSRR